MPSPIMAVAKVLYLCDDVLHDPVKGKIHMIGVFNTIRVEDPATFPFQPKRICVVVQFIGGAGEIPIRVDITDTANDRVIYSVAGGPLRFPSRRTTVYACVRITECVFPAPGYYIVEFYANDIFVEDRVLVLIGEESES